MAKEPVPLKRLPVAASPATAIEKAPEPVVVPSEPKVRDADGRVLPGLTLARMTGAVLVAGSVVPQGGADRHNADRSVVFLEPGAIV